VKKSIPSRLLAIQFEEFRGAYMRWMQTRFLDAPVSLARLRLLSTLREHGAMRMADLSTSLCVTARNITALVDGLEKDGYAKRTAHPDDRRAFLVALTPSGTLAAEQGSREQERNMAAVFERLSPAQRNCLNEVLEVLLDAIDQKA
jgi:DNA-binding MarR family transcriptional regulator